MMYQGDDDVSGSRDDIIGTLIEIRGSLAQQISAVQVVATFDGRDGETSEWFNVVNATKKSKYYTLHVIQDDMTFKALEFLYKPWRPKVFLQF